MSEELKVKQQEAFSKLCKKHNITNETLNVNFITAIVRDILLKPEDFGLQYKEEV